MFAKGYQQMTLVDKVLNSLDPDQSRCFVWPYLGKLFAMVMRDLAKSPSDYTQFVLFVLILYIPVNNFSVMSGQIFLD